MFLFFSKIYDLINYYIELSKIYSATTIGDTVILTLQDNYGKVRQWTSSIYNKTSPDGTISTEMTSFNPADKKYGAAFHLDENQKLPTRSKDEKKRAIFLSPGETTFDQFGRKYICKDISRKGFSDNDNLLQRLKNNDCFVEVVDQFSEVLKILDQEGNTVAVNTNPKPPIEHGPFAKWDMPIYQDNQERYWAKICCETIELQKPEGLNQDLNQQVENKSEAPKNNVLRSFTESAWAVFDKAGEFLFEQHEDGTIDYPATAVSFGLMALQMYCSGGFYGFFSNKNENLKNIVMCFIKSSWEKAINNSSLKMSKKIIPLLEKILIKIKQSSFNDWINAGIVFSSFLGCLCNYEWFITKIKNCFNSDASQYPPEQFGKFNLIDGITPKSFIDKEFKIWTIKKSYWDVKGPPAYSSIMHVSLDGKILWECK